MLAHFENSEMQGYVVAPTGLGKTVIFSTLAKAVGVPALFVVPKQGLVEQTSLEAARVAPNMETGQVYQHAKEYDKQVTITTYASLVTQIKNGKINPLDYGLIILDEAHAVMGKGIQAALEKFGDTPMVGFTATPQFDTAGQRHIKKCTRH